METDLAADRWNPEGVAVAADALDNALHEVGGLGVRGGAERQGIHRGDGPRAHREDVTEDAADARRGALIWLDVRRVVVGLHLEDHRLTVPNIDHSGVFPGAADHLRTVGRQRSKPLFRGLVGAVLVPHGREDAEFGQRRLPVQKPQNAGVFVRLDAVRLDQGGGDRWLVHGRRLRYTDATAKRRSCDVANSTTPRGGFEPKQSCGD